MSTPDGKDNPEGDNPGGPGSANGPGPPADDDRDPWYAWGRWKYIGGALFLVLSIAGVGYVIWDTIDQLVKPITLETIRAATRVSPGRITDAVALAGLISYGPPAGVDLMFGATKAAKAMAKRWEAEDLAKGEARGEAKGRAEGRDEGRAEGRDEGRAEGRDEGRKATLERMERFAAQGLSIDEALQRIGDEMSDNNEQG